MSCLTLVSRPHVFSLACIKPMTWVPTGQFPLTSHIRCPITQFPSFCFSPSIRSARPIELPQLQTFWPAIWKRIENHSNSLWKNMHLLLSQNMSVSSSPPFLYSGFIFGWARQRCAEQQRPLLQHHEKEGTHTQSQGKLAIKIPHCMVMITRPMVKGSH